MVYPIAVTIVSIKTSMQQADIYLDHQAQESKLIARAQLHSTKK